ncbi:MAG: Zn-ribbon domain-containing OB-fold protein [Anaerolineales bacterium]|nr:Zn-ribbon domain-containing OB-fold protein [Anaerolineales bacterium]
MSLLGHDPAGPAAWLGELPVTSRYSFGLAGERFFRSIKDEGVILGAYCPECDLTYVPARVFCERCLAELDQWCDVGTRGEVYTFTLLFVDMDGSPLELPEIVAFIRIGDGGLVHRLAEIDPEQVEFGMPVEAVFKTKKDREGSILDITHFRPVSE